MTRFDASLPQVLVDDVRVVDTRGVPSKPEICVRPGALDVDVSRPQRRDRGCGQRGRATAGKPAGAGNEWSTGVTTGRSSGKRWGLRASARSEGGTSLELPLYVAEAAAVDAAASAFAAWPGLLADPRAEVSPEEIDQAVKKTVSYTAPGR